MTEIDILIKQKLLGKTISTIRLFNINDDYYAFYEDSHWVFDGGIQFCIDDAIVCWGYDYEKEMMELSFDKEITDKLEGTKHYQVDSKNIKGISELQGATIKDVSIKWEFYQNIDENFEPYGDKIYAPIEIVLYFDFNMTLQLALIDFEIDEQAFKMVQPTYDLEGEMLYSFNKQIKINEL
ncbi:hypothetical protein [Carboxylicivirga sp. RSCT41]|uniref:hypothetical protein n=1 Tax=Carboxylicivirga agarovorans TaxID=3417570 RepID=UPI003D33ADD0